VCHDLRDISPLLALQEGLNMNDHSVYITSLVLLAALLAPSAGFAQTSGTSEYDCTIIARTDEFPEGFMGVPSLNSRGRVAFEARLGADEFGIYTGDGSLSQGIPLTPNVQKAGSNYDSDPEIDFVSFASTDPKISNPGLVSFAGVTPPPPGETGFGGGIFRQGWGVANPTLSLPYSDSGPIGGFFGSEGSIHINFSDQQAFYGQVGNDYGIFSASNGGVGAIKKNTANLQIDQRSLDQAPGLSLTTAYAGFDSSDNRVGLYRNSIRVESADGDENEFQGISVSGGAALSPSHVSYIKWNYAGFPGTWEVLLWKPNESTLYSSSAQFAVGSVSPDRTSTNLYREVVFGGSAVGNALFVADGQAVRSVDCRDQIAIFGSDFSTRRISSRAFNSDGQIAFWATTGDLVPGTNAFVSFIVRADPYEHTKPEICTGLPDDTPCDDSDPDTIAYCEVDECVSVPVPEPSLVAQQVVGLVLLGSMGATRKRRETRTSAGQA
jgi:hypothetical protein